MAPAEYREILSKLGYSQEGASVWLKVGKRTSQGYALGEYAIPKPTAILLRLLVKGKITIEDVEACNG